MNMRYAIALMQDNYITASVTFNSNEKRYRYKMPKTWNVQVGDHVIVDSPYKGLVVVEVVHVDPAPVISENMTLKWAVQKVNTEWHDSIREREQEAMNKLQNIQRKKVRQEMTALLGLNEGEENNLRLLLSPTYTTDKEYSA